MRRAFADELLKIMRSDERVVLLTADMGYGMLDTIRDDFIATDRFVNVGAAEQAMIGIAVGLALSGKIPLCYSITSFLVCRPFELIRNYLDHERIPVILVGGGRGKDYAHDGFTHHADDIISILNCWPNIVRYHPQDADEVRYDLREIIERRKPAFLSLKR